MFNEWKQRLKNLVGCAMRTNHTAPVVLYGVLVTLSGNVNAAEMAIIQQDNTALRASPRDSATQQAVMWQGELVEVRGQKMDYVQVYDYQRERGGFVRVSSLRRTQLNHNEAENFVAVLRYLRDQPNHEPLGFAYAAAYIKVASAAELQSAIGSEVFDSLGVMAERLAQRASGENKTTATTLTAHLDVAARYGVKFNSFERDGKIVSCYDGSAYRYVLQGQATPTQRVNAVLALTRPDCIAPTLTPRERVAVLQVAAQLLVQTDSKDLPDYLKNRLYVRRANILSSLAYQQTRKGENAQASIHQALNDVALLNKNELPDSDLSNYNDSIMRTSASRFAVLPNVASQQSLYITTSPAASGETCVSLMFKQQQLAQRCTYSVVWANSFTWNAEQNAATLSVQPMESWRELWVFRKTAQGWTIQVLPPASSAPDTGYIDLAGWISGGKQMLVAREARSEGKYKRSFEVLDLDSLAMVQQRAELSTNMARWASVGWKQARLR